MENSGSALVAWEKICKPKHQGGLGILDIPNHNIALLMKNIYKFLNKADVPWVKLIWEKYYSTQVPLHKREGSFWWKEHLSLFPTFKNASTCLIKSGNTIMIWNDKWNQDSLQQMFPELHSYAKDDSISIQIFCSSTDATDHFHLPLSQIAYDRSHLAHKHEECCGSG